MKIACTGTSSTGKTTLAKRVPSAPPFAKLALRYIGTDARSLLEERGFHNVDEMSMSQRFEFQISYLAKKLALESLHENYITDRSFVDVAAYWIEYTGSSNGEFVSKCRDASRRYDVHLYFPANLISFESDGYRSLDVDVHRRIDQLIIGLLRDWRIEPAIVSKIDLEDRLVELQRYCEHLNV